MVYIVRANERVCPECEAYVDSYVTHLATCELLRARAEAEVDRG